jgi:hypothetical protein
MKVLLYVYAAVPWPGRHNNSLLPPHPATRGMRAPSPRNPVRFGLGSPHPPQNCWTCRTDIVWPVLEINGCHVKPVNGAYPYVCRHQIQAGD